jgi:hypothetical protein
MRGARASPASPSTARLRRTSFARDRSDDALGHRRQLPYRRYNDACGNTPHHRFFVTIDRGLERVSRA